MASYQRPMDRLVNENKEDEMMMATFFFFSSVGLSSCMLNDIGSPAAAFGVFLSVKTQIESVVTFFSFLLANLLFIFSLKTD